MPLRWISTSAALFLYGLIIPTASSVSTDRYLPNAGCLAGSALKGMNSRSAAVTFVGNPREMSAILLSQYNITAFDQYVLVWSHSHLLL